MKKLLLTAMASLFLTGGFAYADCAPPPVPSGDFTAIQMAPNGDSKAGIATIDSLDNPQERGVIVFDWNANNLVVCDGAAWVAVTSGSGGSSATSSNNVPSMAAMPKYQVLYDSSNDGWGTPNLRSGMQLTVDPTKSYFIEIFMTARPRSRSGVNYDGVARYQVGNTDGTYFNGELRVRFEAGSASQYREEEVEYLYDPVAGSQFVPKRTVTGYELKSFSGWVKDTSPQFGSMRTGSTRMVVYEVTY